MKITKRQLRRIIQEAYGNIPDDLNFQVAMKIKDMMPPDEALSMRDEDFRALVVSVFDDHFDETGEGWDPYDDDLKEIEDHLTVVPEPGDADYDSYAYEKGMREGKKIKLSKTQIQNIVRESMKTIKTGSGNWDREDFLQAISDYSKEQDGVRMDLDRAGLSDAPIEKLAQYYKDMFPQGSTEMPTGFDFSDLPTDDEAHPMEKRASRSGMKRRVEGRKRIAEAAPMGGAPDTVGLFQKGRPDPILDALIDDYEDFIEYQGLPTRQSDKAAAEFFKQDPDRRDDHDAHQMLADALGLSHDNIMKHMSESKNMRITKRQLRSIIREAVDVFNVETGEIIDFGEESRSGLPDAALRDLVKRLGLNMSPSGGLSNADFDKLEQETIGKQGRRSAKRKSAQMAADRERLNIDKLLQRLRNWAEDAGQDYMADNPGVELQDVAYDLADAWQFEFAKDEQEELLWHFDGDLNDLKIYAAESMG